MIDGHKPSSRILAPDELFELTWYKRSAGQLAYLHKRDFQRTRRTGSLQRVSASLRARKLEGGVKSMLVALSRRLALVLLRSDA